MPPETVPLPGMPDAPPAYQPLAYPQDVRHVTAERLASALTVSAQDAVRRHLDTVAKMVRDDKASHERVAYQTAALVHLYATIALLRELQRRVPRQDADRIAKELWTDWDCGDGIGEQIREWCEGYGIPLDEKTGQVLLPEAANAA